MCNSRIFNFLFFKISNTGLFWSKITIFIIKITIKLLLHTKYKWNNPNWGRLSLKIQNFIFLPFLAAQNASHTQTMKYRSRVQFHCKFLFLFFEMLVTMSSIRINNNWNYQNLLIMQYWQTLKGLPNWETLKGLPNDKQQKVRFFLCKLVTLILFGTMSQNFMKIMAVVFELYGKVCE